MPISFGDVRAIPMRPQFFADCGILLKLERRVPGQICRRHDSFVQKIANKWIHTCRYMYIYIHIYIYRCFRFRYSYSFKLFFYWRSLPHHSDQGKIHRLMRRLLQTSSGCEYNIPKMVWHTESWMIRDLAPPCWWTPNFRRVFLDKATREWCITVSVCKAVVARARAANHNIPAGMHRSGWLRKGDASFWKHEVRLGRDLRISRCQFF